MQWGRVCKFESISLIHMKDKKPKAQEEINTPILALRKIKVTEEQILANWKAIEDEINRLEAENTKKEY